MRRQQPKTPTLARIPLFDRYAPAALTLWSCRFAVPFWQNLARAILATCTETTFTPTPRSTTRRAVWRSERRLLPRPCASCPRPPTAINRSQRCDPVDFRLQRFNAWSRPGFAPRAPPFRQQRRCVARCRHGSPSYSYLHRVTELTACSQPALLPCKVPSVNPDAIF